MVAKCQREDCPKSVTGRQTYCSDRCRQKARKGSKALRYRGGQNWQKSSSQPIEAIKEFQPSLLDLKIRALETNWPKPVPPKAFKHLEIERVNACTWKVIYPQGAKSLVPASHGQWGGYTTIELDDGQWVAR